VSITTPRLAFEYKNVEARYTRNPYPLRSHQFPWCGMQPLPAQPKPGVHAAKFLAIMDERPNSSVHAWQRNYRNFDLYRIMPSILGGSP